MENNDIIEFKEDIDSYIGYLFNKDSNTVKSDIKGILDILIVNEDNVKK